MRRYATLCDVMRRYVRHATLCNAMHIMHLVSAALTYHMIMLYNAYYYHAMPLNSLWDLRNPPPPVQTLVTQDVTFGLPMKPQSMCLAPWAG